MSRLPVVSGVTLIKALQKEGFHVIRQKRSHIILQKRLAGTTVTTVVPNHRELATGTLRSILRKVGLSSDELIGLLQGSRG